MFVFVICSHFHYSNFSPKIPRSDLFDNAIRENSFLSSIFEDVALEIGFPDTKIGEKFEMVSNVIKSRDALGHDRQFFFLEAGGWDTHHNQLESHDEDMPDLNDAMTAFVAEMKDQELWNDVTLLEISDFGEWRCYLKKKLFPYCFNSLTLVYSIHSFIFLFLRTYNVCEFW